MRLERREKREKEDRGGKEKENQQRELESERARDQRREGVCGRPRARPGTTVEAGKGWLGQVKGRRG